MFIAIIYMIAAIKHMFVPIILMIKNYTTLDYDYYNL